MRKLGRAVLLVLVLGTESCALAPVRGILNGDPDSVQSPVKKCKAGCSTSSPPVVEPVPEVDVSEEEAVRVWGKPLPSPAARP